MRIMNRKGIRLAIISVLALVGMTMVPGKTYAQSTITVSGVISDQNGEPVIGAGILQLGTSVGTATDLDGHYSLTVKRGSTLRVSYLGYKNQEVVADRATINITLQEDQLLLDEVVVVGYGTQRKGDITSAVSSVKAEDFLTGYVPDAAQLVKGKVPGLSVTKGNGDPKASSTIMLRGVTSLMGGYTPLILVDGIEGSLETVAPESIEEISVLKDASAAAIYGTRGASGVILITTKSGKRGEHHTVSYSGYASASNFSKKIDFMDAAFIRDLIADGKSEYSAFGDLGATTDWLDLVTRTGFTQNHNLALEGGTKNMAYSANLTWNDDKGVMKGSYSNDLRVQVDLTQYMFNDIVKLNMNLLKSLSKGDNQDSYTIYHQAVIRNPTMPVYRENGDYYEQSAPLYYYNPLPYINEHEGGSRSESTRMTGNITVTPLSGWETNLQVSRRTNNGLNEYYNTPLFQRNRWNDVKGSAAKSQSDFVQDMLEVTSKYEKEWDAHRFSGMLGYSWMESTSTGFGASNTEFPTDAYLYNALQRGKYAELRYTDPEDKSTAYLKTYGSVSSYKNESRLIGFFGRISYGYDNRYNVLVSFRREGSTKFGADHKWGNFPAISGGWTLSNEKWLRSVKWLDNLKLRVGYGVTGVIPQDSYMSLLLYDYDTSYGNYVDADGNWRPSLTTTQNPNDDLRWEKTAELNAGIDFGFLDGRLFGSVDVYSKKTTDMLWEYNVPVPPNLYNLQTANVGEMDNRGVEVMLGGVPVRTKDFEWSTTVTMSHNKNILVSLSNDMYETDNYIDAGWLEEPTSMPVQRVYEGHSVGDFYMLKSTGLSNSKKGKGYWMIENPETGKSEMFVSGMRDSESAYRQYMGSGLPKINIGWSNNLRYRNFDLALQMSGAFGHKIYNSQRMFYENLNIGLNRYKSAVDPVYGRTLNTAQEPVAVSYYLERGDYVKLDNATLGYNFNTKNWKYVDKARVYVSGTNLLCLTAYKGIDPEMSYGDIYSFGVDYRNKYPTIRAFTFGVNFTFGDK